jgi:hypothetical protein
MALCSQHLGEHVVVQVQQLTLELFTKALRVLEVLHTQRAARNLVFIGRADAAAGGADFFGAALFAVVLARDVQGGVEWQDQRAGLEMRKRERTSTPAFSSPSISSNSLAADSTTPLPM